MTQFLSLFFLMTLIYINFYQYHMLLKLIR